MALQVPVIIKSGRVRRMPAGDLVDPAFLYSGLTASHLPLFNGTTLIDSPITFVGTDQVFIFSGGNPSLAVDGANSEITLFGNFGARIRIGDTAHSQKSTEIIVDDSSNSVLFSKAIATFTPPVRTSTTAPYLVINAPADTGITAGSEGIGVSLVGAIRRHSSNTAVATQREYVFGAPTYSFASANGTITDAITVDIADPVTGSNAVLTNIYSLRTGVVWIKPSARALGVTPYLTVTAPTDTALTAGTEAIGVRFIGATRQHASNTTVTLQREYVFGAPTYSFATGSPNGVITTAITLDIAHPVSGTNASISTAYSLRTEGACLFRGPVSITGVPISTGFTVSGTTSPLCGITESGSGVNNNLQFGISTSAGHYSNISGIADCIVRSQGNGSGTPNLLLACQSGGGIKLLTGTAANNDTQKVFISQAGGLYVGTTATDAGANNFQTAGKIIAGAAIRLKNFTVAALPTGTQGDMTFVTDALAPGFLAIVVGGGAIVTPVFYNGTNWVAF